MEMAPILTIAIPTFNRADKLERQLSRLVPLLGPEIRCAVYDNASTDGTAEVAAKFAERGVTYQRSPINLGIGRNLLRCFETCETAWLWVLSDDDHFVDHAIEWVLGMVKTTDCDFIHTSSHLSHHAEETKHAGIEGLFDRVTLSALFWISAGIYRMETLGAYLNVFASGVSTWVPQTLMVLAGVESGNARILFSNEELIESAPTTPRFSTLDFIVRLVQAPEYLRREVSRSLVAEAVGKEHLRWALLTGLREVTRREDAIRWKRVAKQAPQFLSAYRPSSPWTRRMKRRFEAGQRKMTLERFKSQLAIWAFRACPLTLFDSLLKHYPHPEWLRRELPVHGGKFAAPRY